MSAKPLPEDAMVCAFRNRAALIASGGKADEALSFVRELADLEGKVELRLVIDRDAVTGSAREHDTPARPVILDSKYPGKCKKCGKPYAAGDSVKWLKNVGCFCVKCK